MLRYAAVFVLAFIGSFMWDVGIQAVFGVDLWVPSMLIGVAAVVVYGYFIEQK